MQTEIYNIKGEKTGKLELPEAIFGLQWNADLVHQVVTSMQANARHGKAHTKDRGEVRGGGKKPWQQKGTGRARHGSSRSPIWKGGGTTHGPRNEKNYALKINRAMRQKALLVTLSKKYKDGEILFVDSFTLNTPKTKTAQAFLAALSITHRRNAAYVALPARDANALKSFRNLGHIEAGSIADLNPVSVLSKKQLIIVEPKAAFEILAKKTK